MNKSTGIRMERVQSSYPNDDKFVRNILLCFNAKVNRCKKKLKFD